MHHSTSKRIEVPVWLTAVLAGALAVLGVLSRLPNESSRDDCVDPDTIAGILVDGIVVGALTAREFEEHHTLILSGDLPSRGAGSSRGSSPWESKSRRNEE